MTTGFTTSADFYEILANSEKRLEREGPLLLDYLRRAPGSRVLDLACGTGLHSLLFAKNGAQVTARDISESMIEKAREIRPHENIAYGTGDMRDVSGGPWDYVLCLGNSLSLVRRKREVESTFGSVYKALSADGIFLLQLLNYAGSTATQARHRVERARDGETNVVAIKSLVPHGQWTLLTLNFFADNGTDIRSVSETAVQRNWQREDVVTAARNAGFVVETLYGDFDATPYDSAKSNDLIIVLRKP